MLFNSLNFALFFPIVFFVYWLLANKKLKIQNAFLLIVSYFFYSCWDWRFLFLLLFSTLLDYYTAIKMQDASNTGKRKFWFWLSIGINLGFLGVFKYYNFFIDSFAEALATIGFQVNYTTLNIILPVGISFYTFHGLSYVIDIYNKRIEPVRNFVDYALFVSFFPLLVAGPIERATHLLPQIQKKRVFEYSKVVDGMRQILWGLFKKVVIADNCAIYADMIFNDSDNYNGSTLILGALFFAVQIYGDFSGYSDIALGTARMLGIELLRNFAFPYFSRDIAEFWRRWHISLSTWFRDYLYFPLGGSRGSKWMSVKNTFIIFLVSGFWHGANWTFIVWGFLNALYFLPLLLLGKNRNNLDIVAQGKLLPSLQDVLNIFVTFSLTTLAWIFFRAESLTHAWSYLSGIFSDSVFDHPQLSQAGYTTIVLSLLFFIVEWFGRDRQFAISHLGYNWPQWVRWGFYSLLVVIAGLFMQTNDTPFIYFQF